MKLTKEGEALKLYYLYWDSYLKGELDTFSSTLNDTFEMIDTSEREIVHTKAEGIQFLKAQADEIVGKVEMRNRSIQTIPFDPYFLINESCDIYFSTGDSWDFYSKIRISTFLKETSEGWKVTQQHGSLPDMRVQEGETMAINKIQRENLELRDAVKRRTAELENKNRELAIEAALEKVRTVAMGMKKRVDMLSICRIISEQLQQFGVTAIRNIQTAIIDEEKGIYLCYQYFSPYDREAVERTEYLKSPVEHGMVRQMLASKGGHFTGILSGKYLEEFREHRKQENHFPDPLLDKTEGLNYCFLSIGQGGLGLTLYQPIDGATLDLFKRFHQVFTLAYSKFQDIEKAEARAREVEIELALERVRAMTMAMHSSEDVGNCILKMFSELTALGVDEGTRFGIGILNHDNENNQLWTARKDGEEVKMHIGNLDMSSHPLPKSARNAWKAQVTFHQYVLEGEDLLDYYQMINNAPDFKIQIAIEKLPKREVQHCFIFEHGLFYAFSPQEFPQELIDIIQRFSSQFAQTYRRYLDLVKAEAQSWEAEIELALERVRSRSMAMHKSDELLDAGEIIFVEMQKLGIDSLTAGLVIMDKEEKNGLNYAPDPSTKKMFSLPIIIPHDETMHMKKVVENWKNGAPFFIVEMDENETIQHQTFIATRSTNFSLTPAQLIAISPSKLFLHNFYFKEGYILIAGGTKLSVEQTDIMLRFAKVFQQTYTRFLDLQKAEAQAREAQIEVALERVRSKTMAMHNSADVDITVTTLFNELINLGVDKSIRSGIGILNLSRKMEVWTASTNKSGETSLDKGILDMSVHSLLVQLQNGWETNKETNIYELLGDDLISYFKAINDAPEYSVRVDLQKLPAKIIHYDFYFPEGGLFAFSPTPLSEELLNVFKRFTGVFGQTYRRFLDLQKAEAQTREAQIEVALERVRSRTLAMQNSEEMADTAYVLFEQLNALGVTHERINIGIVNEDNRSIDFWITEQGGTKLKTKFSGRISEPTTLAKAYSAWKNGDRSMTIDLQGEELKSWLRYLNDEIKIPFNTSFLHDRRVQTAGFFSKGMLIVTSPEPLQDEALYLLEKFAGVFDLTYTRFSDLQVAESQAKQAEKDLVEIKLARQKAEEALNELKATQSQLVQQEKLASLGQLTAGIAHEIKNPLNFVNNFSEVSIEMIEEALEEMEKREARDETLIRENLEDIRSNLKKVHEHGSRANGIVTSMLQHSRGGSGKKEPTDINALIKEYSNLAFHGMRAGKNPINAAIDLQLDEQIKEVSLIGEDFSRVLLNLCNNAFDAMRATADKLPPKLTIRTKLRSENILIEVEDNGPGIPEEIKDKILQPFFTTKKGTEGTGLGLSITHDIIKAHGGELKVKSTLGEGSIFSITIPTN